MSELDIAKRLFGTIGANGETNGSESSRIQNQVSAGSTIGTTSTRYGTVKAIGENNYLTILLDGSTEPIHAYCETPVTVGQRVSVSFDNGTITVVALSSFVDSVEKNQSEVAQKIEQIQKEGEELAASVAGDIAQVEQSVEAATSAADSAKQVADSASKAASAASQAAEAASSKAEEVSSSLGTLSGKVDSVETTVNGVRSDVDELGTTVTATQQTAQSALTAATSAQQDITGFKTTVSQTYETKADADAAIAQEVLDRNSAISQSATQIKQEVSENYVSNETGETLATKAEVTQSANQIRQEVSESYQVKGDYATNDGLDAAIAQEVTDRNSAITQSANSIKQEVSQNYVNNETGATLATKAELTTAIDGISSTVSKNYLNKNDASKTYATKTEVSQTADSIKQEVSDTYQVKGDYATNGDVDSAIAQEVLDRNSAIEQSASSITSTVSQNYQSKADAGTMQSNLQSQITQNAKSITQEVSDRKTAVSGAVSESKAYTDTTAQSLTTSISESVMDEVGSTYATKTEVTQTSTSLTTKITAAQSTADAAKTAASNAATAASNAQSTANTAKSTADSAKSTAETANSTANTAKKTADTAKSTADTANSTANTAKSTAESASSTATTAKNTANTASSTANTAKSTADSALSKANTVSAYFTEDITGLTVGIDGEPSAVKMATEGEFQVLQDDRVVSSFSKNEIHLGNTATGLSDWEPTNIYLFNDTIKLSAGSAYDPFKKQAACLSIEPATPANAKQMDFELTGTTKLTMSIGDSASYSETATLRANNDVSLFSSYGGCSLVAKEAISFSGDEAGYFVSNIIKPAISIGGTNLSQALTSSNATFAANTTYGDAKSWDTSTAYTRIYRSGNYVYIRIPRCASSTNRPVAVEVSAQARAQGVSSSNLATEIVVAHSYGGASGSPSLSNITSPIQTGNDYVSSYICPHIITLPRSAKTSSYTYDIYYFRLVGRVSNATGVLQSWTMTVRML